MGHAGIWRLDSLKVHPTHLVHWPVKDRFWPRGESRWTSQKKNRLRRIEKWTSPPKRSLPTGGVGGQVRSVDKGEGGTMHCLNTTSTDAHPRGSPALRTPLTAGCGSGSPNQKKEREREIRRKQRKKESKEKIYNPTKRGIFHCLNILWTDEKLLLL